MGRRIRIQSKETIYFVTNRCFQQRFFFRPSPEVNRIILGCLARAAATHKVRIFAFVFMSNHFHLLLQALLLNLPEFMRDFQSSVARELNRLHGRKGKFFERRYSCEDVLDDAAFVDRLDYTLNNPCRADLVRHIDDWPGISSWDIHKTGEPMVGKWLNREKLRKLRRKDPDVAEEMAYEEYALDVAPPPLWAGLDAETRRERVTQLIDETAVHLQRERARLRNRCAGPEAVMAKHWSYRPKHAKKSPRPLCHSGCAKLRAEHQQAYWTTLDRYREAMGRHRRRRTVAHFPHGTIPPGHVKCVGAPPRATCAA